MTSNTTTVTVTQDQLAHIGEGIVAYVRETTSEELKGKFPGLPEIAAGNRSWALFAANGQPILLSDATGQLPERSNDLTPVAVH